jgi:hypothetical protein
MPRSLLDRCRPDSIYEFREAARQRLQDGRELAEEGRRTGAIYLWGYAAEMTLKAAYCNVLGFAATRAITMADLRGAAANAPRLGFVWVGNLHHVESWAQLLVSTRTATPGLAYPNPAFGTEVVLRARRLQRLWSEFLRYHKNVAYIYEVNQVREVGEWFHLHSANL